MFTVALFAIARTWKQPKCPSTEGRIKKTRYVCTHTHTHTMEYYSAIQRNGIGSFVEIWIDPE